MRLISELWKDIGVYKGVDFEGKYEVSSKGTVRNKKTGYCLTPTPTIHNTYPRVTLTKGTRHITAPVHRLVAIHFLINPNGYKHTNHKDENTLNYDVNNLEWCTQKYNNGYLNHGRNVGLAMGMPTVQLDCCGSLIKVWETGSDPEKFGYNSANICECANNHRKTHKNYVWMRKDEYDKMTKEEVIAYCKDRDKRIAQVDKEWNLIHLYSSLREIDQTKYCESMIYDVIRGKREFYRDCRWMKYSTYLLRDY